MVLVELQSNIGDGKLHESLGVRLEPMPLDHQVEGRHCEGQSGPEIVPDSMGYLLQMPYLGQHREYRLHQHPLVPLAPVAQFQVGWISRLSMETQVSEDHHLFIKLGYQWVEVGIMNIGRSAIPGSDHTQVIEDQAQLAANDPAVIGLAFPANLARATTLPSGVDQFNAVAIDDPQQSGSCQEGIRPILVLAQQPEEPGAMRQAREQLPMVARQPAIEGPITNTLMA